MTDKSTLLSVATMTGEQLDTQLKKGYASIKAGRVCPVDEVDTLLAKEFDLEFTPTKKETTCPQ